jgi:hypothetical protein
MQGMQTGFSIGGSVFNKASALVCVGVIGATVTARADSSVRATRGEPAWMTPGLIGSVGGATTTALESHYVPDWREW